MALVVNTNIVNQSDGYSVDDKSVKGGTVTVATIQDRDSLPAATNVEGRECYVTAVNKRYRYTAGAWREEDASDVSLNASQRLNTALTVGYADEQVFVAQRIITRETYEELEIQAAARGETIAEYLDELYPNTLVWVADETE